MGHEKSCGIQETDESSCLVEMGVKSTEIDESICLIEMEVKSSGSF